MRCFLEAIGVFDFMQRHENRSAADLKQCMPVLKKILKYTAYKPFFRTIKAFYCIVAML